MGLRNTRPTAGDEAQHGVSKNGFAKNNRHCDDIQVVKTSHDDVDLVIEVGGHSKDRAAVVATAIIQIVITALRGGLDGEAPEAFPTARHAIEAVLRQEFFENTREARDEIPPPN